MRMAEAQAIIASKNAEEARIAAAGYRVSFERREGIALAGDFFPARDEPPIPTAMDAWNLALSFAMCDPEGKLYVNIRVVSIATGLAARGYRAKLNSHPKVVDDGDARGTAEGRRRPDDGG